MATNDEQIMRTWILVADSAHARLFLSYPGQPGWFELRTFEHPAGRAKGPELLDSPPAMEPGKLPKDFAAEVFARELAKYLDLESAKNSFERLVLVAPPKFLGMLRENLSKQADAKLAEAVNKDLVGLRKQELEERLEHH